jgi:hypothetical protein
MFENRMDLESGSADRGSVEEGINYATLSLS